MIKIGAKLFRLFLLLSVVSGYTPVALPQTTTTGAVEGKVYDASSPGTGKPIPNARITITNEETGLERTVLANQTGDYLVATLPPGTYTISAEAQGYQGAAIRNFGVRLSKTNTVAPPIGLQPTGAVAAQPGQPQPTQPTQPGQTTPTTITTTAASAVEKLVNSENASRGGNLERRVLITLPLPGVRTFDDFAFLFPGVAPPPQAIGTNFGPGIGAGVGTSGQFSVNGVRSRSNNFTIDGSDNNDEDIGVRRQGFTSLVPQSIESLQELQVITLLAEPQFGRSMGAQVNAVSRSGGNLYNGTLYAFFTNDRLKARDPFDFEPASDRFFLTRSFDGAPVNVNGSPVESRNLAAGENEFRRGQYGFVLGGPIHKPHLYFFSSYEHQDIDGFRESHFAVPTIAERGVLNSGETGLEGTRANGSLVGVFPTNLLGDAFFSLFPFPNNPAGPYGPNNFTDYLPIDARGDIFSLKFDFQTIRAFNREHTLTARYNFTDDDTILPVTGEALFSSLDALVRTQNLSLIFNTNVSLAITNQARFSWGRTSLNFEEVRSGFLLPSLQVPNVPFLLNAPLLANATRPTVSNGRFVLPGSVDFGTIPATESRVLSTEDLIGPVGQVIVSGYSPLGVDVFNFPQNRTNNTYQIADTLIYTRMNQKFTGGFDIRRLNLRSRLDRNFRPLAFFSGARDFQDVDPNVDVFLGNNLVAAGAPTGFFQTLTTGPDSSISLRNWQYNLFLQDQIRVRPNFTLTLGLRYELNTVPTESDRRIENTFASDEVSRFIDIENRINGVSGLETFLGGRTRIFRRDDNNIGPHFAFAWDPFKTGLTSVRGGYGIYYDQIPGAVISQSRNVFPTFLTVNTAGISQTANGVTFLVPFNPIQTVARAAGQTDFTALISPGTLNQLNPAFVRNVAVGGDVVGVIPFIQQFTNNIGGSAFVLPSFDLVTPYTQHWSLTVERQIANEFLASVAYVGTKGSHLLRFATPNLGPNAIPVIQRFTFFSDQTSPLSDSPLSVGFLLPPGPGRPFPTLGSLTTIESDADSIYHALQVQLNKRFFRGIQMTTAYTWSHAIDEVSDIFDLAGARALPQNSFDREAERGDANFDVRHRFTYSFIWDLPLWNESKLLGGWQFASLGQFQKGQPYSVLFCCDANLDGNLTDRVAPDGSIPGQAPRNLFRAPGLATVDVSVNKFFRFNERYNLEFRTEIFNVFNHANFGVPANQLFFGGLGAKPLTEKIFIDTRVPMRTVQFAVKYNF